jgi:hypothetical protein
MDTEMGGGMGMPNSIMMDRGDSTLNMMGGGGGMNQNMGQGQGNWNNPMQQGQGQGGYNQRQAPPKKDPFANMAMGQSNANVMRGQGPMQGGAQGAADQGPPAPEVNEWTMETAMPFFEADTFVAGLIPEVAPEDERYC